jgi:uncharacterized membrane protein YdjX (TVP38/TMEM64 family)
MYYNNNVVYMESLFNNLYNLIMSIIDSLGVYGPLFASFLIICESIIPPLPLFVFITINFLAFGKILGFIISWICTCLGCILSYFLVKKCFSGFVLKKVKDKPLLDKWIKYLQELSLVQITVILSIPFTPAFMVNIAAGLVKMDFKKFFIAILISKIFLVYFWGFVGTGLVESFNNPTSMINVILMIIIACIVSYIIKKIFKIN